MTDHILAWSGTVLMLGNCLLMWECRQSERNIKPQGCASDGGLTVLCTVFLLVCAETIFSYQQSLLFPFYSCILFPRPNLLATVLSCLTVLQNSTSQCHWFCLILLYQCACYGVGKVSLTIRPTQGFWSRWIRISTCSLSKTHWDEKRKEKRYELQLCWNECNPTSAISLQIVALSGK